MDSTIAGVVYAVKHWAGEHIRMLEEFLKGHPNRLPDEPVKCPDCGSPPRDDTPKAAEAVTAPTLAQAATEPAPVSEGAE